MKLSEAQKTLTQLRNLRKEFVAQLTLLKRKQHELLKKYNKDLEQEKIKQIRSALKSHR